MTTNQTDLNSSHRARWLSWGLGAAMLAAVVAAALHFSEEQAFVRLVEPPSPGGSRWQDSVRRERTWPKVACGGAWAMRQAHLCRAKRPSNSA
jgi:hypothetical protein